MPSILPCPMFMIIKLNEDNQKLKKCVCDKLIPQGAILEYIYQKSGCDTSGEKETYICDFCNNKIMIILV